MRRGEGCGEIRIPDRRRSDQRCRMTVGHCVSVSTLLQRRYQSARVRIPAQVSEFLCDVSVRSRGGCEEAIRTVDALQRHVMSECGGMSVVVYVARACGVVVMVLVKRSLVAVRKPAPQLTSDEGLAKPAN